MNMNKINLCLQIYYVSKKTFLHIHGMQSQLKNCYENFAFTTIPLTCGYLPNFHPHTSNSAKAYFCQKLIQNIYHVDM